MKRGLILGLIFPMMAVAQLNHPIPPISEKKDEKEIGQLSLEKSIRFAVQATTGVLKAQGESEVSAQQLLQGYFQFLPNLQATGTYNRARGQTYLTQAT